MTARSTRSGARLVAVPMLVAGLGCAPADREERAAELAVGAQEAAAATDSVRRLMDRMAEAIRARDPDRMIRTYPDSGHAVFTFQGRRITSTDSIAAHYRRWREGPFDSVAFEWEAVSLEPLGATAVLAYARFTFTPIERAAAAGETIRGVWTGVFRHQDGRWALVHEHESW